MLIFDCSAILFDLDGVLVDSTASVSRQWRRWARGHGLNEDHVNTISHGVRSLDVIRMVAPHLEAVAEVRELERHEAADQEGVAVMPGAVALVNSIPTGGWCVVTSGTRYLATARLNLAGIPIPSVMITADDVANGKPNPEPYLKGAAGLGFQPGKCLVIEDAPAGLRAARTAGMKAIGLTSTYQKPDLHDADAVVEKLSQIKVRVQGDGEMKIEVSAS